MLVCYHRAAQSAIPAGGGCVVTKQVALLINVLMWHYSGLYPPPFRLGFHTGRGCAEGITLNKHSNSVLPDCVAVFGSFIVEGIICSPVVFRPESVNTSYLSQVGQFDLQQRDVHLKIVQH